MSNLPRSDQPAECSERGAIGSIVIVIPAHNERELLPGCLQAVEHARRKVTVPVTIVVVLDACVDGTAQVVPSHIETVTVERGSVGAARRAGFDPHTTPPSLADTWFATTDADSRVPADWLVSQLDSAARGSDAFVGTVVPMDWDGWSAQTQATFDLRYHRVGDHDHTHGANLGIRADIYRQIGGFDGMDADEDVDLVRRLTSVGARIDWSRRSPVLTSTRRIGRAAAGFADYLRNLETLESSSGPRRRTPPSEVIG